MRKKIITEMIKIFDDEIENIDDVIVLANLTDKELIKHVKKLIKHLNSEYPEINTKKLKNLNEKFLFQLTFN